MSRRGQFETIRSEGALLPADLLQRVAERDKDLGGLRGEDYGLLPNEPLNEAIVRSWNRLVVAWASFREGREKLPDGDPGTTVTRDRWLLVLLQELGYGRVQTANAVEIEGKSYAVSHAWENVPIHLVGCNVPLDRRSPGVAGAATQSPHGTVQELLNRSEDRLWGIVSNGLLLRVLRDNSTLTRQAYLEFDLEEMFEGEVYADFVLLWLLCHASRVEGEKPHECWLERWSQEAVKQGTRALDGLRNGVEQAIEALGSGFLQPSRNVELRTALRDGELTREDYYRQLLRLVYRLLFLFVAEDRGVLFDPRSSEDARGRYRDWYSTRRLRELAGRRRGTKHADLYEQLKLVMEGLGSDEGCEPLGLPAVGSFLWSRDALPHLEAATLPNGALLDAIRALATVRDGKVLRSVDYKNLGAEELGSVYESLLELHPELNADAGTFSLTTAAGNERKTTGSYYTPSSLISCLLDSALDPVLDEAAAKGENAILDLKVCDPACGSGHFLVAAAHRIAKRLASVRTGDEEPSPEATRHALRDVVSRCLYGVDVNPMAVELCKVSLWMEALDPGRPLSFLDTHITCGNSLLGTTPNLLGSGIPDEAFRTLKGDDGDVVRELRRRNRQEREGQLTVEEELTRLDSRLAVKVSSLERAPADSMAEVHAKERQLSALRESPEYLQAKLLGDAWCAAFVCAKRRGAAAITQGTLRRIAAGDELPPDTAAAIREAASEYHFFHWHIEFPTIFERAGGFDCVLANPPWERVQFEERAFFASRAPAIAAERNQARRRRLIAALAESDPALHDEWQSDKRRSEGEASLIRGGGRYPLSGVDKFNLYALFAELFLEITRSAAGFIVKGGLLTDKLCAPLFNRLMSDGRLVRAYEFENRGRLFPGVDPRERYVLTIYGRAVDRTDFTFDNLSVADLADTERHLHVSAADLRAMSPNVGTCPKFANQREFAIARKAYASLTPLIRHDPPANPWRISIDRYINVSDFSDEIVTASELARPLRCFALTDGYVPIAEGKLMAQFDHRFASYPERAVDDAAARDVVDKKPSMEIEYLRYLPAETALRRNGALRSVPAIVTARDITNRTNERGVLAALLPANITDYTLRVFRPETWDPDAALALVALLNSFAFDFFARQKLGGTHLSSYILEELPVPPPDREAPWWSFVVIRSFELSFTSWSLAAFSAERGWGEGPFVWSDERRKLARAELDAMFFHVYGLDPTDIEYVLDMFPIVRRKDEQAHGEYRTKRLILEIYDELAEAIATGRPYQTRLDPPPADPRVAHPLGVEAASPGTG